MKNKTHKICLISTSLDNPCAGWYVKNSNDINELVPNWRTSGKDIDNKELKMNLEDSLQIAMAYTIIKIEEAKKHLKMIEKALDEIK